MANKVTVMLLDDVDGTRAIETVQFGLDGMHYQIDLNMDHASKIREQISEWTAHARPVAKTGKRESKRSALVDSEAIREWARGNGYDVKDRGRLPLNVLEAYRAVRTAKVEETPVVEEDENVGEPEPVDSEPRPATKSATPRRSRRKAS